MGDRTTVTLTILRSHVERAEAIMGDPIESQENSDSLLTAFVFYEVNYGDLDFLPALAEAGIPYDSDWCEGDDYGAGTESCRFDENGEIQFYKLYDSDHAIAIDKLVRLLDDPPKLVDYIKIQHAGLEVPGWDDQEEYSKLYLTRKLIEPSHV